MQYPRFHEAAHSVAWQRGVKDTSRQGRYHNHRFRTVAEEVGLQVQRDSRFGWTRTDLRASTAAAYSGVLREELRAASPSLLTVGDRRQATATRRNQDAYVSVWTPARAGRRQRVPRRSDDLSRSPRRHDEALALKLKESRRRRGARAGPKRGGQRDCRTACRSTPVHNSSSHANGMQPTPAPGDSQPECVSSSSAAGLRPARRPSRIRPVACPGRHVAVKSDLVV